MWKYLKHLFQLILSPGHGWEDISASGIDYRTLAGSGFYPLTAVTAVTTFLQMLYHDTMTLSQTLMKAIIAFVIYFLGYFISTFVMSLFLAPIVDGELSEQRYHSFVLYSLGLLEFIAIIANCVPVPLAITSYLPIYVAIIMWKGSRYMAVKQGLTNRFVVLALIGVLAPPYLLKFLFNILMPQ